MRYMAPQIATLFNEVYNRRTGALIRTVGPYYSVLSTKFGRCGHDHKTKKAAQPCLRKLKLRLTEIRRAAGRKASATRKANGLAEKQRLFGIVAGALTQAPAGKA